MSGSCCVDDFNEKEPVKEQGQDEVASCCEGHAEDLKWLDCICGVKPCLCGSFKVQQEPGCC